MGERRALTLLAASMFAEARELPDGSELRTILSSYCDALMNRASDAGCGRSTGYEIRASSDGPALRRLATLMDALSFSLGQGSAVAALLSGWSFRLTAAVAEADTHRMRLEGPSAPLLELVQVIGRDDLAPIHALLPGGRRDAPLGDSPPVPERSDERNGSSPRQRLAFPGWLASNHASVRSCLRSMTEKLRIER